MRAIRHVSICGNRRSCECFNNNAITRPITTPITNETLNTSLLTRHHFMGVTKKNTPIPSKNWTTPIFSPPADIRPNASNMTIATASLSKLSPKMMVKSFGSTL
jgi:hypothetical protein